jgi:hypothetical protein
MCRANDSPQKIPIRAITAVSHEELKFDHFFDNVQGEVDFEWSDKFRNMEMKDIFDIDLVNIPQPSTNNKSGTKL